MSAPPPKGLDSGPAVLAEGLKKRFGETQALDGVDLRVERAQVVGLLGPNGAGKTTAVRVFTTLIKPDAGRAFIDGIDVLAEPSRAKARIGLTGQYAAVDERLTGAENLEHVGRLYHMPDRHGAGARARAARAVRPRRRRRPGRQGLLGRHAPPPRHRHEPDRPAVRAVPRRADDRARPAQPAQAVWELIEELVAGGTTTLLTTQYLDEADRLADEIVVIDHGRVIATRHQRGRSSSRSAATASRSRAPTRRRRPGRRDARASMACGEVDRATSASSMVVPVFDIERHGARGVRQLDARRRRRSPTSSPASPRSTTCSSPSPATPPRTTRAHSTRSRQPMSTYDHDRSPRAARRSTSPRRRSRTSPTGRSGCSRTAGPRPRATSARCPRNPELLMFATIQPIMFIVLFVYVFEGSVQTRRSTTCST